MEVKGKVGMAVEVTVEVEGEEVKWLREWQAPIMNDVKGEAG